LVSNVEKRFLWLPAIPLDCWAVIFYEPGNTAAMKPGCVAHLYVQNNRLQAKNVTAHRLQLKVHSYSSVQVCDATVGAMKTKCPAQKLSFN